MLKGSYSQYYEGIFNDIYKRATPGEGDFITYDASGCPPFPAICGLSEAGGDRPERRPASTRIDPDLKHPRVDETSLGLERALSNDVRLSVTGIYRDNKNIVGLA